MHSNYDLMKMAKTYDIKWWFRFSGSYNNKRHLSTVLGLLKGPNRRNFGGRNFPCGSKLTPVIQL